MGENKYIFGIVADDITGANDIGAMFSKYYFDTKVYVLDGTLNLQKISAEVMIIDTNSRFDDAETAAVKVKKATSLLNKAGCEYFFNKTCSVFRGNIGAEFDAMLDELGLDFAPVVLGFPKNGRITKNGIHYVHGKKLEESEFANDPIHPMKFSFLPDILQEQSRYTSAVLSYDVVDKGQNVLREELAKQKKNYRYSILDVLNQNHLTTIAQALINEKVIFGSSAIAEELAKLLGEKKEDHLLEGLTTIEHQSILLVAGSVTPQTRAQIHTFKEAGLPTIPVNTLLLLTENERETEISRVVEKASRHIDQYENLLIHATNQPDEVCITQIAGEKLGFTPQEAGKLISSTLATIVHQLTKKTGVNKLIVAGGDTSAALCQKFDIKGVKILYEIEPGLPSCFVEKKELPLQLVLKSGSFGKPNFFLTAINHFEKIAERKHKQIKL